MKMTCYAIFKAKVAFQRKTKVGTYEDPHTNFKIIGSFKSAVKKIYTVVERFYIL